MESTAEPTGLGDPPVAPSVYETDAFLKHFVSGTWRKRPPYAYTATPGLLALVEACPPLGDEDTETWATARPETEWSPIALARLALFRYLINEGPGWSLAQHIWDRASSPLARTCLFCEAGLWRDEEWWTNAGFAAQAVEAMRALVDRDTYEARSTWGARGRLRELDWERGARNWAPRTWWELLVCATGNLQDTDITEVGAYLKAYASSGAPPMPKDLLSELLESPAAEVRLWAQCELARHGVEAAEMGEGTVKEQRSFARMGRRSDGTTQS